MRAIKYIHLITGSECYSPWPVEAEHVPWSAAFREVGHIYLCSSKCPGAWAGLWGLEVKVTLARLLHGPPSLLCSFGTPAQRLLVMTKALRGMKEQGEGALFHRGTHSTQVPRLLHVTPHMTEKRTLKGDDATCRVYPMADEL